MNRRIRRREHELPQLNLASLPDLIFTVLFFFMIVTHMRDVELKVQYKVPQGTELEKLVHKQAVSYIYIGPPTKELQGKYGQKTCIQLNDKLATAADIEEYIKAERKRMSPEDAQRMTVSIKADEHTDVGTIADVKQALRRAGACTINYSSLQKKPIKQQE